MRAHLDAGDDVMVDVPLYFEAGEARGIVRFDSDAGLPGWPSGPRHRDSRVGHPGRGGGAWLRMVFPAGLVTWLVPSGWTVSCQPSSFRTT